ncbi:MAG: helix-turn-helix transcriptional regulator [Flavobacteriaceae bacterium]|nr:helix-turn-helix transcriptional regulator [Flavobacteriaceae bacterium]
MDISERLKIVMDYYELTPSNLADQLDVQRSSISHLLSGRNNPSLDFVMKILDAFPEVDLYWFVNGVGEFPLNENKSSEKLNTQFSEANNKEQQELLFPKEITEQEINPIQINPNTLLNSDKNKLIEQIVIFYTDGSFANYIKK